MHCLPDGGVVHVQVVADRAHHHLAGIESDAALHLAAMCAPNPLAVAPDRVLHGQGGVAGPYSVVLMRNGGAEQRHDTITHHLVDGPLIAMHGRHHALQHRVEELPGLFRIAVGQQLHRAFEVRKQDSDELALAFQGTARR